MGEEEEPMMSFGRRSAAGQRRLPMFGAVSAFGKRRATKKVSKKAAMKAFRSFYKRHCAGRRSGFGYGGGNPPLNASMGYEFCPNGMGGVLGFNSTGLFPSPCISQGSSAPVQMGSLPPPTKVSQGGFGRRRYRKKSTTAVGRKTAAGCAAIGRKKSMVGGKKSMVGDKKHKMAKGSRRPRRAAMY